MFLIPLSKCQIPGKQAPDGHVTGLLEKHLGRLAPPRAAELATSELGISSPQDPKRTLRDVEEHHADWVLGKIQKFLWLPRSGGHCTEELALRAQPVTQGGGRSRGSPQHVSLDMPPPSLRSPNVKLGVCGEPSLCSRESASKASAVHSVPEVPPRKTRNFRVRPTRVLPVRTPLEGEPI